MHNDRMKLSTNTDFSFRGYIYSKLLFWKVNRLCYGRKFRFMAPEQRSRKTQFATHKSDDIPPQMTIFGTGIPILMHFFTFSSFTENFIALKSNTFCRVKPDVSQWEATFHNDVGLATVYHSNTVGNFDVIQSDVALHSYVQKISF